MADLFVGVGKVTMLFRHAEGLKDKRRVLKSVQQKLRNLGFTVTECGYQDNPKRGIVGFAYVGHQYGSVDRTFEEGMRLFIGEMEIVDTQKDIFDYSTVGDEGFPIESYEDLKNQK